MKLVKIIRDDDGVKVENPCWHYIIDIDAERTLCGGECFGIGESRVEFLTKEVDRGITCPACRRIIKNFKKIKL